jgi:outer membrane cobalamin receptor
MITTIGTIELIWPMEVKSKGFKVLNFVIKEEIEDNYLKIQAVQDMAVNMQNLKVGQKISLNYTVKGRMYVSKTTGKQDCFTTLNAISFMDLKNQYGELPLEPKPDQQEDLAQYEDDLPF